MDAQGGACVPHAPPRSANVIYLPLAVDIEFKIQADDVGYISPVAGDKVAVTVDTKNLELLQVYSLNSGRIICSVGDKEMKGMTEVSVGGKLCLAISFWYNYLSSKNKVLKQEYTPKVSY